MECIFDLVENTYATLTDSNGLVWDVNGDSLAELKEEATAIANYEI